MSFFFQVSPLLSLDPYLGILNPSCHHSKIKEVHILNCKETIHSTNLIIQLAVDVGSAINFAKPDNEDGVVNSPPNKGLMRSLVCSPSPLKKTMRKVSSPLQNDSGPLVQQKKLYGIENSHLCSRKDGGRIQRWLEPTMSDPIVTQNYGAKSNMLAAKDISRATKSTIPCASHSQGIVPRLWLTKKKLHLKT